MRLSSLRIRNFRGIHDATIQIDPRLTVLIGGNNAGKTTVLDALAAVMSYRRGAVPFQESDFRSEQPGQTVRAAPSIVIDLRIVPTQGTRFERGELGDLRPEIPLSDGRGIEEMITLRMITAFDPDPALRSIGCVLRQPTDESVIINKLTEDDLGAFPFREQLPFRAFGVERDIRRGTQQRWSDWGRLLADIRLENAVLEQAMKDLINGNQHLFENTQELRAICEGLRPFARMMGVPGAGLSMSAIPEDPDLLLRQMSIVLKQPGAARGFSADRQGMGTQGALLFAFYGQFVRSLVSSEAQGTSPVLTVEEPETHLHPTAQRAMAQQLADLPGQVIVSSHAPDIIRGLSSQQIVVMRSENGASQAHVARLEDRILREHAHALFARVILLVEGDEAAMMPILAEALKIDLFGLNIEVVNAGSQNSLPGLWRQFGRAGYGFPVVCVGDADQPQPLRDYLSQILADGGGSHRAAFEQARSSADKAIGGRATLTEVEQRQLCDALRDADYYCAPYGSSLEQVLAREVPDLMDDALVQVEGCDFQAWRLQHGDERVKLPGRTDRPRLSELDAQDARVCWLTRHKTTAPSWLAQRLSQVPDRVPDYLAAALRRAAALAQC